MKIHFRSFTSMTLALVCGLAVGGALNWSSWAQQLSPLVAYTAQSVERSVNPDGTERRRNVRTIARRSDGSVAIVEHRYYNAHGQAKDHPVRHIKDTKTRKFVSVYPLVDARISAELSDGTVRALAAKPDPGCLSGFGWALDQSAPTQKLAGQRVIVRERQLRPTDTQGVHMGPFQREWVAPDLDCLVMRRESRGLDDQGEVQGTTTIEVTAVTIGEPSAELFAIPPDAREMTPSEVVTAQNKVLGIVECAECARTWLDNADQRYYANQSSQQ